MEQGRGRDKVAITEELAEVRGLPHKSLLFLTTTRPEATPDSFIIAKRFTDCSPLGPSSGEAGAELKYIK